MIESVFQAISKKKLIFFLYFCVLIPKIKFFLIVKAYLQVTISFFGRREQSCGL